MITKEDEAIIKRGFKLDGMVDIGPYFAKYANPDKDIRINKDAEVIFQEILHVTDLATSKEVKHYTIREIEGNMNQLYRDINKTNLSAESIQAFRSLLDLIHKKILKAYPVRNDRRRIRELGEYDPLITGDSPEKCPYSLPDIILIYDKFFQFITGRPVPPEKFFRYISLQFLSSKAQDMVHSPETVSNAYYRIFDIDYNSVGEALRTFKKPKDEKRQKELMDELIKPDESLATS